MARILFAWELGANFGHLGRQIPVAVALRRRGHQVCFAVRDIAVAAQLLEPLGFDQYIQAPFFARGKRPDRPPANYAEILLASGYSDPETLRGLVRGWLNLFRWSAADLIVTDHAPSALFAAYLAELPVVCIGSGFEIPPLLSPLPSIRPWENIGADRLRRPEQWVVERLNTIAKTHGRPSVNRLADLYRYAVRWLATFAELDHYGFRDGERYCGPIAFDGHGQTLDWLDPDKPHLFAYLRPGIPGFELLLLALSRLAAEVIVVAPEGVGGFSRQRGDGQCCRIVERPIRIDRAWLGQADLAVTYAGAGTVSNCLLAGTPMLLLPQNVEQYLMALSVENLGAGLIARARSERQFAEVLTGMLRISRYRQSAQAFATRYAGFDTHFAIRHIVDSIEGALCGQR